MMELPAVASASSGRDHPLAEANLCGHRRSVAADVR
jgi:hypothetical protein